MTVPQRILVDLHFKYVTLIKDKNLFKKYNSDIERDEIENDTQYLIECLKIVKWLKKNYWNDSLSSFKLGDYMINQHNKEDNKFGRVINDLINITFKYLPSFNRFLFK
jgi:hypothetical protein